MTSLLSGIKQPNKLTENRLMVAETEGRGGRRHQAK